jgi:hypothetical protein
MNRQEGRPDDSTSTIDPVKIDAAEGMSAGVQTVESMSSSNPIWKAIGPAPLPNGQTFQTNNVSVSGRTVTIALHPTDPNIAYVGAAQGGVYRTTDGGATWTAIFDNAQTLAIGSITSEPSSNNWSFIGTGGSASCTNGGGYSCTEYVEFYMPLALGPGTPNPVYSGTDRLHRAASPGSTNATVSQTFANTISAVAVSRQNDGVRLVGLSNGQVWRTMNGSTTLTNVSGTLPTASYYYISRAAIDPNNQNTAYVTYSTYFGNSTSHIYKTTNLNAATPT